MIFECRGQNYEKRLLTLGLTTLEDRHYRADMIQVFNILNNVGDIYPSEMLPLSNRLGRRNSKKLYKRRNLLEITRNSFTSRVVDLWNNLPDDVVSSIDLNTFKGRLDKEMRDVRGP